MIASSKMVFSTFLHLLPLVVAAAASTNATAQHDTDYAVSFEKSQTIVRRDRQLSAVQLRSADGRQTILLPTTRFVFNDLTRQHFTATPGDELQLTVDYRTSAAPWMHTYVYLDRNANGRFDEDELLAFSYANGRDSKGRAIAQGEAGWGNALQPPAFVLPKDLPLGNYRMRVKVDWNNTHPAGALGDDGTPLGNNGLVANGGAVTDITLEVHATAYPQVMLHLDTRHANVYAQRGALSLQPPRLQPLTVRIVPVDAAFEAEQLAVRYGRDPFAPEWKGDTLQWQELPLRPDVRGDVTLPAEVMNGPVRIIAHYKPTKAAKWIPVFNDEFDGSHDAQPNAQWWSRTERQGATWNRYCSNDTAVVFVQNGELVCRAMATPERLRGVETAPFITGGVKTQGKFSFRYGRAEARILTHPHSGNFPAFWMMPQDNSKGWPNNGEIDIWEQVNTERISYHTLHSHWTYDLGHKTDPTSAVQGRNIDYSLYHTYAVEWTPTLITWYVDGQRVGSAPKSTNADALANGQWPYDAPFYLILNQSVGNGSWALNPDPSFVYETRFDWVRVYQTAVDNPRLTGIEELPLSPLAPAADAEERVGNASTAYDLSGRRLSTLPSRGTIVVQKGQKRVAMP